MIKKASVMDVWGSATRLANALDISAQTVHRWPNELTGRTMFLVLGVTLAQKGLTITEAHFGPVKR